MHRWGPDGPPPEAYSRVTNPERFRPLHDFALTLLAQLHGSFDVDRIPFQRVAAMPAMRPRMMRRPV
jgi:hypothetical protein